MQNPIGMVYQINDRVSRDAAVAFSRQAYHFATTSLNDFVLAQRLKKEAGVRYSIFRNQAWEPGDFRRPNAQDVEEEARTAYEAIKNVDRSIHVLINNEQEWTNERFQFYIELIKLTMADPNGPVGMVFGNFSAGSVKCGQGDDPNWWETTPAAREFLILLQTLEHIKLVDGAQAFVFGDHQYTALYPWSAVNGGEYLRADWADVVVEIDWKKPQWHIMRMVQGIRNAGLPVPYMIITETLFDNMKDIVEAWNARFPSIIAARGYHTLEEFWKFHGSDFEYHDFLEWTWENLWSTSDRVLGVNVFIFNGTGSWETFDVSQDEDFKQANMSYAGLVLPECPDVGYEPRIIKFGTGVVNVRTGPGLKYPVDSTFVPEQEIRVNLQDRISDANWFWYPVLTPRGCRWVSDQGGAIRFELDVPEESDITILMDAVEDLQRFASEQRTLNANFVTKGLLQSYFEQLMSWTALNFVSKFAFLGWFNGSKEAAKIAVNEQNVGDNE